MTKKGQESFPRIFFFIMEKITAFNFSSGSYIFVALFFFNVLLNFLLFFLHHYHFLL